MKIRGDKIKQYRKKSGLSQSKLAEGICTQATVSLIEKNNQLPSMPILYQLCARLGVEVEDVVETGNHELTDIFSKIDQAILVEDDQAAANLLNTIRIKQLRTDYDKQRYYYFLGMLQLLQDSSPTEALFNFNLALKQFGTEQPNIYQVLATAAAGRANLKQGDQVAARQFAEQGSSLVAQSLVGASPHQLIALHLNLASLNLQVDQLAVGLAQCQRVVQLCRQFQTLFGIDRGYYQLALAQQMTGDVASARQNLQIAESLSVVCEHPQLLAEIRQQRFKQQSR